jgi:hypothetical protein
MDFLIKLILLPIWIIFRLIGVDIFGEGGGEK